MKIYIDSPLHGVRVAIDRPNLEDATIWAALEGLVIPALIGSGYPETLVRRAVPATAPEHVDPYQEMNEAAGASE